MQIGSNSFYDVDTKYTIKLNDKEMLVVQEDELRNTKLTESEKIQKETEKTAEKKEIQKSRLLDDLSPDEERLVNELSARDAEVKRHEAAHQAAGSGMTGAASYTYQQGPDGKMYAIGGEVSISMQSGATPEETIANARQVATAAMAASNPSPQDFAVASSARIMEMKAQQQLTQKQQEQVQGKETYSNETTENDTQNLQGLSSIDIPA